MDEFPSEFSAFSNDFEDMVNSMIDRIKKEISYEIKDVEEGEDGDKYIFTVEMTVPELDDANFEDIFAESLDETALTNMLMAKIEEGVITETSTEQEMLEVILPEMIQILNDILEDYEFETTTKDIEIVVAINDDDEWLIDAKKSDWE